MQPRKGHILQQPLKTWLRSSLKTRRNCQSLKEQWIRCSPRKYIRPYKGAESQLRLGHAGWWGGAAGVGGMGLCNVCPAKIQYFRTAMNPKSWIAPFHSISGMFFTASILSHFYHRVSWGWGNANSLSLLLFNQSEFRDYAIIFRNLGLWAWCSD